MYAEHAFESYNISLTSYNFYVYNAIGKFSISNMVKLLVIESHLI